MQNKLLLIAGFLTATFIFTTNAEPKRSVLPTSSTAISAGNAEPVENEDPSRTWTEEISELYNTFSASNASMPSLPTFTNGMKGYTRLLEEKEVKKEILTIVDFSLPSTEKRMWILDMTANKVLYNTYVSHGQNTGGDMATEFSNIVNSFQSSLGFYMTAETYYGRNGLSLRLDGMEEGFNSRARERYIVVHGADYSNPEFIAKNGRLGRSQGCPAVPTALSKQIIETIKEESVLFVSSPDEEYQQKSTYLNLPKV